MTMFNGFRVLEKSIPPSPHSVLLEHRGEKNALLFESHTVSVLSAQETAEVKKQYIKILEAYGCLGVLQVNAGESTLLYLIMITGCFSIGKVGDSEVFRITQTQFIPLHYPQNEDRIIEVRKLINSGTFYFSWYSGPVDGTPLDLTLCAQRRNKTSKTDHSFFWNRMLHLFLMRFDVDCSSWLVKVICGSVEIRTVYVGHRKALAAVISRLSCERAGTRFNVRGTNDEGHVANFVETEQVIFLKNEVNSYLQTRGSVPLFWEQPGMQVGSHRVRISRGYEVSKKAFDRHMTLIKEFYGKQVIVNLLGTSLTGSKEGEATLSNEFQRHHRESLHVDVPHIVFDYHQECRGGNQTNLQNLKAKLEQLTLDFSFFYATGTTVHSCQTGTIRTNCLDCLDRTNCVQTFLGLEMLGKQLVSMQFVDKKQTISRFEEIFKEMWINNGNEISKVYAGTGAIQGGSKIMDGARSAARTIQNNLLDNSKQEAIDILLVGSALCTELANRARTLLPYNTLHAPNHVLREMCKRYAEYTELLPVRVAVGTYNVNGGKHFRSVVFKDVQLSDWLLDPHVKNQGSRVDIGSTDEYKAIATDIFAIGFEEIVDLNTANIVNSNSDHAKAWAIELQKVLSRDRPYVLLTYQQLVGVCLYVFVQPEHVPFIRDVAVDAVKTGLGGHTGNKGAAAIRFVFYATSFAFVCAHFAAGQSQVNERNADYNEITRKIIFPMNQSLNSHEYIFWCGDFNYRVDMDKEEIKKLVKQGDFQAILRGDQLKKQQEEGNVFKYFTEGEINFPPSYKYDLFSEDYDTSERCRAPAWTDRVLWKRNNQFQDINGITHDSSAKLVYYGRAELKQSDHRPVIAIVDVEARQINEEKRQLVFYEVLANMGPPDATIIVHCKDASRNDESSVFDDEMIKALLKDFSQFGETILIRFVADTLWITFRESQTVMEALKKTNGKLKIQEYELTLSLKSPNWIQQAREEVELFSSNTVPLYTSRQSDHNCLGISESLKTPRSMLPSRPPPPVMKSNPSSPKRKGILSMPTKPSSSLPPTMSPSKLSISQEEEEEKEGAYAEIHDIISRPEPQGPPPSPPRPDIVSPTTLSGGPPPVPARFSSLPPLPARPRH